MERGGEACMKISSNPSRHRWEDLYREDDAERNGQKETGVEKEGEG